MQPTPVSRAGAEAQTGSRSRPAVVVRDLIADSVLETPAGFSDLSPAVTVVLPTFRRGDNGMLEACIASVLAQTFNDLELIVIDDGSTDSTRRVIEQHMAADPRIATIRHPKNVGLPALSCYEGIARARSSRVFFTFDDNTLVDDALETMMAAADSRPNGHFFYGEVLSVFPGHDQVDGAGEFSRERLFEGNFIPNGAVLADREVFERCGHYDPHISMTRLCDWDLWIRISREYELHHVDKVIATERGRTQSDSIGNTHVWDRALVAEWMSVDRSARLRPEAILDYDVAEIPPVLSELSRAKIETLTDRFFGPGAPQGDDVGYTLLVCDGFTEELLDVFTPTAGPVRVVGATYFQLEVLGFWDLVVSARTVVLAGDVAKAEIVGSRLRAIEKRYDYYVPEDDRGFAVADAVGREFFGGVERLLRRGTSSSVRFADAESIDALRGGPMSELRGALDNAAWSETPLALLAQRNPVVTMLGSIALENGLVRTVPRELVEVVPNGYYTPHELTARVTGKLRRRPWALFGYLRSGLRGLGSR